MTIHKEGYPSLIITIVVLAALNLAIEFLLPDYTLLKGFFYVVSVALFLVVLQFFRHPSRNLLQDSRYVVAPADGKVVVIEETDEPEFLKERRIQVSIFMSPINVHVNRYPVSGKVLFAKHHHGLYLVAWHPKSSTENERTTIVLETANKTTILLRQIAGALARRIVMYPQAGLAVRQGEELGFIKFGSRVDLFLPLNAKIKVDLNQKTRGGETIIAELV